MKNKFIIVKEVVRRRHINLSEIYGWYAGTQNKTQRFSHYSNSDLHVKCYRIKKKTIFGFYRYLKRFALFRNINDAEKYLKFYASLKKQEIVEAFDWND